MTVPLCEGLGFASLSFFLNSPETKHTSSNTPVATHQPQHTTSSSSSRRSAERVPRAQHTPAVGRLDASRRRKAVSATAAAVVPNAAASAAAGRVCALLLPVAAGWACGRVCVSGLRQWLLQAAAPHRAGVWG